MGLSNTQQEQAIDRVMRPYLRLPRRGEWGRTDRQAYLEKLPDVLAGLLRQYCTRMLDLGKLCIDDPATAGIFRGQVFDTRDQMTHLLREWLVFFGVTDDAGVMTDWIVEELTEEARERYGLRSGAGTGV